jgi:hypothetical protein
MHINMKRTNLKARKLQKQNWNHIAQIESDSGLLANIDSSIVHLSLQLKGEHGVRGGRGSGEARNEVGKKQNN